MLETRGGEWFVGGGAQAPVWITGAERDFKVGLGGEVHFGWREKQRRAGEGPLFLERYAFIGRAEFSEHKGMVGNPDAAYYRLLGGFQVDFLWWRTWGDPIFRLEVGAAAHYLDVDAANSNVWGAGAYISPGIGVWLENRVLLALDVEAHVWVGSKGGLAGTVAPTFSATFKF